MIWAHVWRETTHAPTWAPLIPGCALGQPPHHCQLGICDGAPHCTCLRVRGEDQMDHVASEHSTWHGQCPADRSDSSGLSRASVSTDGQGRTTGPRSEGKP